MVSARAVEERACRGRGEDECGASDRGVREQPVLDARGALACERGPLEQRAGGADQAEERARAEPLRRGRRVRTEREQRPARGGALVCHAAEAARRGEPGPDQPEQGGGRGEWVERAVGEPARLRLEENNRVRLVRGEGHDVSD